MTNRRIADVFERVAALLEEQGGDPHRIRAWRLAADAIATHPEELGDVFRDRGRAGLEAIPHVGEHLSAVIIELIRRGTCAALIRLREATPVDRFARIHDDHGIESHRGDDEDAPAPPVALLLEIDRAYRARAAAGELARIAPRRFNPTHEAWLPVMHDRRDGWVFTALYSNTELAHRLGRTHDWVVVYYHLPGHDERHATVVTETHGALRGQRVVRGRERECAALAQAAEPRVA